MLRVTGQGLFRLDNTKHSRARLLSVVCTQASDIGGFLKHKLKQ